MERLSQATTWRDRGRVRPRTPGGTGPVKRSSLMAGAAGTVASPLLAAASRGSIPVVLEAGRFFAVPRVAGGQVMKLWLDTDGGGFVFEHAVRRLRLPVETGPNGARLTR